MRSMASQVRRAALFVAAALLAAGASAASWVAPAGRADDFPLADGRHNAAIVYSAADARVVGIAVHDLAADIQSVTGREATVRSVADGLRGPVVLVGTIGRSPLIDALAASGKLDLAQLHGAWESFVIATVDAPMPGVARALVIAGSDPRGAAFGAYELSQAIGVSPWHWWADVAPARQDALYVARGTRRFGPPSVKYRGVFLNDEDWGLQPWAAKTFEPEHGGIGPKTYARLFELLLRLKANTLWPAMHPGTPAFNSFPQNAQLAGDYAIVMGSSHAEPMLRNNVSEWTAPPKDYNYLTNRDGVLGYWNERVAANGRYENIYTVGMRGVHDSRMQGPKTDPERIALLEKIFADQRDLLAKYVDPHVEQVPQLFCAYKEVLGLYRQGLKVPDDVTIMWPDDNFGYVRNFAGEAERRRSGGFGVYYHLSYLGAPLSYIWLGSTPPALVWEEMNKAYDFGADRVWIANVGDLKPAEIDTEFFLQMAWDIGRWQRATLPDFLPHWAAREFGAAHAREIAAIMGEYYQLNYRRRPEHLQWWLPKEAPRHSALSAQEAADRLRRFTQLMQRVERLRPRIRAGLQDAFFELVAYPVTAASLANQRFLEGERGNEAAARAADARLARLTDYWNTGLAGGKWRHIMAQEPADQQWRSFRISKWEMPASAAPAAAPAAQAPGARAAAPAARASAARSTTLEAERFTARRDAAASAWQVVPGLGRSGAGSVAVYPSTVSGVAVDRIASDAPRLDYPVEVAQGGALSVRVELLPTHPLAGKALRVAVSIDDAAPQLLAVEDRDGGAEWAQGVLDNVRAAGARLPASAGKHTLHLFGVDPGVVVDRIVLE